MDFEVPPEIFPGTTKYTLRALVLQGSDIPVFKFPNAQVIRMKNHKLDENYRGHCPLDILHVPLKKEKKKHGTAISVVDRLLFPCHLKSRPSRSPVVRTMWFPLHIDSPRGVCLPVFPPDVRRSPDRSVFCMDETPT